MRFLPKSDGLLDGLAEHARLLGDAADLLAGELRPGGPERRPFVALEKQGDELIERIIGELRTTFLTPLDRDDLFNLATRLGALLASIGTALFFRSSAPARPEAAEAAKAVGTVVAAVTALKDDAARDRIREQCLAVRALERRSEHGLREGLLALAVDGASLVDLWKGEQAARATSAVVGHAARAADAILLALLDS